MNDGLRKQIHKETKYACIQKEQMYIIQPIHILLPTKEVVFKSILYEGVNFTGVWSQVWPSQTHKVKQ